MSEVTSYTREECIPKLISPKGVKYGVFRDHEVDLYEVFAVTEDELGKEKPDRRHAKPVAGQFTGQARALEALRKFLVIAWDESDAAKLKAMKPHQRAALNKAEADTEAA